MNKEFHCYSFRQLSPFQGYYHIIEIQDCQAVTRDGLSWQINVKTIVPMQEWGSFGATSQRQAVLFGFWDKDHGIKRLPLNPLVSADKVEQSVRPILENIEQLAVRLPFKPIDDYEFWLLDKFHQQPLVLLASASLPPLAAPKRLRWNASTTSELGFIAPSIQNEIRQQDTAQGQPHEAHYCREAIERLIREEAAPTAQWYKRTQAGVGIAVNGQGDEKEAAQNLQKNAFPPCLIRESWDSERATQLVAEYIGWQAPLLLQLRGLEFAIRQKLEILARQAPEKVAHYYNLYPEIIDQQQINAALVEAVMKRAQTT
ncbi:hypothetical protein [Kaarinaea lacus]